MRIIDVSPNICSCHLKVYMSLTTCMYMFTNSIDACIHSVSAKTVSACEACLLGPSWLHMLKPHELIPTDTSADSCTTRPTRAVYSGDQVSNWLLPGIQACRAILVCLCLLGALYQPTTRPWSPGARQAAPTLLTWGSIQPPRKRSMICSRSSTQTAAHLRYSAACFLSRLTCFT